MKSAPRKPRHPNNFKRTELALLCGLLFSTAAQAIDLQVVSEAGTAVKNYRWLIEEDTNYVHVPGQPALVGEALSYSFHKSYMPVVAAGKVVQGVPVEPIPTLCTDATPTNPCLDPAKRYFASILPSRADTFNMSGAQVNLTGTTKVQLDFLPIPTAQISVLVFNDEAPLDNTPSLPGETGLAGFTVQLIDAGGTYGASGGPMSVDVFGNPLGTTYDADGNIVTLGTGILTTDANGVCIIQNLAPGKYTITVNPPTGTDWIQVTTIEGTKGIDAWVKANEPPMFVEFGPPGWHVFMGFVKPRTVDPLLGGTSTITGRAVWNHITRPPALGIYPAGPVPGCWVGLNDLVNGGTTLYAGPCADDSTFTINNVPPGDYQVVIWDDAKDVIIDFSTVIVPDNGLVVDIGDHGVNNWFANIEGSVFYDTDGDGFRDPGEVGIPDQAVNLRWRDGSIYQIQATAPDGSYGFPETFPFFNWNVLEVDFARFQATGATMIVDAGGEILPDQGWDYPSRDKLVPQPQYCMEANVAELGCTLGDPLINPNTGNNLSRTETGAVLLQGIQPFAGETNVIDWGKKVYPAGMNGGISGVIQYASTRAEDDPWLAVGENNEPGVPRVQVNLYKDQNNDRIIDDLDLDTLVTPADVDNYPFGWAVYDEGTATWVSTGAPGPEDVDRNANGTFDLGDAIDVTRSDSWDDNQPTACQGTGDELLYDVNGTLADCYDGWRNFNQIRPAVFDGGYAFGGPAGKPELPAGTYIVEASAPRGYLHQKEEDKNVDFGETYVTSTPAALPPPCVGDLHKVPTYLTLFPTVTSIYAGQMRPLCDRKQVILSNGSNVGANFHLFTMVPIATHVIGTVLDDIGNEINPLSPMFGEKRAATWVPVSFRDWKGREIQRTYADQWGRFNALLPSTFTYNIPMPSGVSPHMVTGCMNSPMMPDPNDPTKLIVDPWFNRNYTQTCFNLQYLPGKTTYLDTPVLHIAAFTGHPAALVDCEYPDGTPMVYSATGSYLGEDVGPWIPDSGVDENLVIVSLGNAVEVPNPDYDGTNSRTIVRDFGFGDTPGTVMLGTQVLATTSWSADGIVAVVPPGTKSGQLTITRGDNATATQSGVYVTVGGALPIRVKAGQSIQAAIDLASPGRLITVAPGVYEELPIMHKPVRLQGWGAASTVINAVRSPQEKITNWRTKIDSLLALDQFDLLPGQDTVLVDPLTRNPMIFATEEGAGITVVANVGEYDTAPSRIDGFTVTGADNGGGIFVNGYVNGLTISNNRLMTNMGTYGGGIRVGSPHIVDPATNLPTDNQNDNIKILTNQVTMNGSIGGGLGAGGLSLYTGADNYNVRQNLICGNLSQGFGAGFAHHGYSVNGLAAENKIVFNQSTNQGLSRMGGGVFVGGLDNPALAALTPGAGSTQLTRNIVQGNLAESGDGGGVALAFVNGLDVAAAPNDPALWNRVTLTNNMIVDNVAALAGGGISLQDTVGADIIHNTVANNDSTATADLAFGADPNLSNPQPAGVISRAHSAALAAAFVGATTEAQHGTFSNPLLANNIIWHSRSFQWSLDGGTTPLLTQIGYDDLAVLGTADPAYLNPVNGVLTTLDEGDGHTYSATNVIGDPAFVSEYFNSYTATGIALDEGGNAITVYFKPITLLSDYHIGAGSSALGIGLTGLGVGRDIDMERRPAPTGTLPDAGADEISQ